MGSSNDAVDAAARAPNRIATLPNAISALRLAIALGLPFVERSWLLPLIIAGALTDWLDGFAAKVTKSRSTTGQLLDPLADKALFLSALLTLMLAGEIRFWQLVLILTRDLAVVIVISTAIFRRDWWAFGRMKPSILGKITTVLVFAWLVAVIVPWVTWARQPLFFAAAGCSAVTAVQYFQRLLIALRQQRQNRAGAV
jgi:cardiolipin synthase